MSSPQRKPRILVVEDAPDYRAMLERNLEAEGYEVVSAADGMAGLERHAGTPADLVVLDLTLPGLDGLEILELLRKRRDEVPVLVLTARPDERTKLRGFELGADDYLTKPFSMLELLFRVRAILRRSSKGGAPEPPPVLASGPFRLDTSTHELQRDGVRLDVGVQGARILGVLLSAPGKVHSRSDLLNLAWAPGDRPGPRTVDAHIFLIRRSLGEERTWLSTVGRSGYRWNHPVTAPEE